MIAPALLLTLSACSALASVTTLIAASATRRAIGLPSVSMLLAIVAIGIGTAGVVVAENASR